MSVRGSFTVDEWCKHRHIGKWKLYEMWKRGGGPRFYFNGPRRLITAEADDDWIRQQEALADTPEARAAIERASAKARAVVTARRSNAGAAR